MSPAAYKTRLSRRTTNTSNVRIRVKHVDEVDPHKVALAFWMLAERLVREKNQKAKGKALDR